MLAETLPHPILTALEAVKDPEIPVLSIVDLGIITEIEAADDLSSATVTMTPTFSGCPALHMMREDVRKTVEEMGYKEVKVEVSFEKPWSTDRISERGRELIKNFGLAPPQIHGGNIDMEKLALTACPHCNSTDTTMNTMFGPTLCRSLHFCFDCMQAFEAFKPV